jgi:hypothetical protein
MMMGARRSWFVPGWIRPSSAITLFRRRSISGISEAAFDLVELIPYFIPLSGYFSPEVMATSLSALTGLEHFSPGFQSYQTRPDQNI